jgi:predicted Zn-dependent protease
LGQKDSQTKDLILAALGIGATVGVALPFSRSNESEADEIGLIYMARAGYDPREAPLFWQRFGKSGGGPPEFLSTHPKSDNRAKALESQLARALPIYETSPKLGKGEKL